MVKLLKVSQVIQTELDGTQARIARLVVLERINIDLEIHETENVGQPKERFSLVQPAGSRLLSSEVYKEMQLVIIGAVDACRHLESSQEAR